MIEIIQVKKIVRGLCNYVKEDFNSFPDEKDTFLYKLLNGIVDGNYDFYQQAKSIFLKDASSPKNIKVLLELPKDPHDLPLIVIREPSRDIGQGNTVGKIVGEQYISSDRKTFREQYQDSKRFSFELMCISGNAIESILISEVLYALLLGGYETLAAYYNTVSITMRELMPDNEIVPYPTFFRSINLNLEATNYIPSIINQEAVFQLMFDKAHIYAEDKVEVGYPAQRIRNGNDIKIETEFYLLDGGITPAPIQKFKFVYKDPFGGTYTASYDGVNRENCYIESGVLYVLMSNYTLANGRLTRDDYFSVPDPNFPDGKWEFGGNYLTNIELY